jgi:hypothetical protein
MVRRIRITFELSQTMADESGNPPVYNENGAGLQLFAGSAIQ